MAKAMLKFKKGDMVCWTSQAGGYHTTKTGKIIAVVPPNQCPRDVLPEAASKQFRTTIDPRSFGMRKEESYVVVVPGKTPRQSGVMYWPLTSRLTKAA